MGLTYIEASIANPARPRRTARIKFLVDSGASYSVVPAAVLRQLGIKRGKSKTFILADGTEIKRSLGEARFSIDGEEGTSPVIFGEEGDSTLMGCISLKVLGFMLDPFKRELRPLPMLLAHQEPSRPITPTSNRRSPWSLTTILLVGRYQPLVGHIGPS
jgi:clan AA aspartic protease